MTALHAGGGYFRPGIPTHSEVDDLDPRVQHAEADYYAQFTNRADTPLSAPSRPLLLHSHGAASHSDQPGRERDARPGVAPLNPDRPAHRRRAA